MSKLLIYVGEGIKFDLNETIGAIKSIDGVVDARTGDFIGAVFECFFGSDEVIVRISKDCETFTIDGAGEQPLTFILQLQKRLAVDLWLTDMNYSCNLEVSKFSSVDELQSAMESA